MNVNIHFAKPVSIYDNTINKCAGRFCHCEVSIELDSDILAVIIDSCIQEAHDPLYLTKLLLKVKKIKKKIHFCFYVLLNEVVSIRFFNDLGDEFNAPPDDEIYETIKIEVESIEKLKEYITWNLCQINKPYDLVRAALLFFPVTLRTLDIPDKFFCSQLVMHSLKKLEMPMPDKDINHMKPDDVYDWLCEVTKE